MKRAPLWVKLLMVLVVLAAGCVGVAFIPTRDVAYAPVAPIDLEGKISIDGQPLEPLQGRFYLVGVQERRINLLQRAVLGIADSSIDFGTAPPTANPTGGPTTGDFQAMSQAKQFASAVAYELADGASSVDWTGTYAAVAATTPGTPAAGQLQPGDVVIQVNGVDYDNAVDLQRALFQLAPGTKVTLFLRRAGEAVKASLTTIAPVANDRVHRSRIGVTLDTVGLQVKLPHKVVIDSGTVVGPSAGLAFALALYDGLDRNVDLLRGRHVVVTGDVGPDGQVGPIGLVRQKAIAAQRAGRDLLIVPTANVAAAMAAVKDVCSGDDRCIEVKGVSSVQDAISILRGP